MKLNKTDTALVSALILRQTGFPIKSGTSLAFSGVGGSCDCS